MGKEKILIAFLFLVMALFPAESAEIKDKLFPVGCCENAAAIFSDPGVEEVVPLSEAKHIIFNFPMMRQADSYYCGVACTLAIENYFFGDRFIFQQKLATEFGTNSKSGTNHEKMLNYIRGLGLKLNIIENMTISQLQGYLDKNIPVLILLQAWSGADDYSNVWGEDDIGGHAVVAVGYSKDKVFFMDPYVGRINFLSNDEFLKRWHYISNSVRYNRFGVAITYDKPPVGIDPKVAPRMR